MAVKTFSLAEIKSVDGGRVVEAFDALVRRAIADCEDRPGNKKPRAIGLALALVPRVREGGECYEIEFAFDVKASIPTTRSPGYLGSIRRGSEGPAFVFDDLTGDVSQPGLDRDSTAFDVE